MSSAPASSSRLTAVQWLVCIIAAIGFAFDTYELLMLPLIATPALSELLQVPPDNPLSARVDRLHAVGFGAVWRRFWSAGRLAD